MVYLIYLRKSRRILATYQIVSSGQNERRAKLSDGIKFTSITSDTRHKRSREYREEKTIRRKTIIMKEESFQIKSGVLGVDWLDFSWNYSTSD